MCPLVVIHYQAKTKSSLLPQQYIQALIDDYIGVKKLLFSCLFLYPFFDHSTIES
jgi:hypothetical protein